MSAKRAWLRSDVKVEPLFDRWYAWTLLVPPATAALYVAKSHVPVLESFVEAPEIHEQTTKDPAMVGGPFLELPASRVGDVRALLDRTRSSSRILLELARDLDELAELVATSEGSSLEPLYDRVPSSLRGLVELTYDPFHRASFRFFERLVYRSPLYDPSHQELGLSRVTGDHRPFALSTPSLDGPGKLFARVDFRDDAVDELFRSRLEGTDVHALAERLGIRDRDALDAMFEASPRRPPAARYDGDGVRVRYFGHASVLVETRDVAIMTDPAIGFAYEGAPDDGRYTIADLPPFIDYVVISHLHQDHLILEMLLMLRHRIGTVVVPAAAGGTLQDPSIKLALQVLGFRNVVDLEELETLEVPGGRIRALPFLGEHGDLDVRAKMVTFVELLGRRIVLAADSNNLEPRLFDRLLDEVRPVDVIFIGMECEGAPFTWGYKPLLLRPIKKAHERSRRVNGSDFEGARAFVDRFECKQAYVYAMGQEPWLSYVMGIRYTPESRPIVESNALVSYCRERGIPSERLFVSKELHL